MNSQWDPMSNTATSYHGKGSLLALLEIYLELIIAFGFRIRLLLVHLLVALFWVWIQRFELGDPMHQFYLRIQTHQILITA